MNYVFISYVKEDEAEVFKFKTILEFNGIKVWLDKDKLNPGEKWRNSIRKAIKGGMFFIACFSENYLHKDSSYMNEELILAIEELRLRPYDKSWFIPIRLSDCEIPDRPIGAGETLADIQWIDIYNEKFMSGVQKICGVLFPILAPHKYLDQQLDSLIKNKIKHFHEIGAQRFKAIEDRWLGLIAGDLKKNILKSHFELSERARKTGRTQTDRIVEQEEDGRVCLLSVCPHDNLQKFLMDICPENNQYEDFIINQRKNQFRQIPNWKQRDLIHLIHFLGKNEALLDMFYFLSPRLHFALIGHLSKKNNSDENIQIAWEQIYPTTIIDSYSASMILQKIYSEDAEFYK